MSTIARNCAALLLHGHAVEPGSSAGRMSKVAHALAGAALVFALPAHAINLGSFEVQSSLGQRLRMVVQIATQPDETVEASCFKVNPYTVSSDGLPQLTNAQVALERTGGRTQLLISSTRPINDPIFRISVEVGCETALRRDLTVLLDPPPVLENAPQIAAGTQSQPSSAAAPTGPQAGADGNRASSAPAPTDSGATTAPSAAAGASAAARAEAAARRDAQDARARDASPRASAAPKPPSARAAAPRTEAGNRAASSVAAAAPRSSTESPASGRVSPPAAAKGPSRDRLTISASQQASDAAAMAPLTPRLTLATTLSDRPSQPLPESMLGILRQKQARLRAAPVGEDMPSLEAELVVLQKRTAELRSQLDAAMAQMQLLAGKQMAADGAPAKATPPVAPSEPAATPVQALPDAQAALRPGLDSRTLLVAALIGMVALFAAALVLWVRRERAERRRRDHWNASPYVPVTRMPTAMPPPAPIRVPAAAPPPSPFQAATPSPEPAPRAERPPLPDSYAFTPFSAPHAANQLGVSDLAQATEKASVFVTLGRPEQAIDVLRDHVDHEPKPSPMAWLMLIDLYRQTGRRAEFNELADRFHHQFNAETPQWEQQAGRLDEGLAAFPRIMGQLREGWPHAAGLDYIENLLYDNRGGSRVGFSLPAFRDLLLLHSILEEYLLELKAHHEGGGGALDMSAPEPPGPPSHLARVWTNAPKPVAEDLAPRFELDVRLLNRDSPECSALEKDLPEVAEAIVTRWGKPGTADYLTNLIALSKDDRNSDVSDDMMGELLMLQEVACDLEESRARHLSF